MSTSLIFDESGLKIAHPYTCPRTAGYRMHINTYIYISVCVCVCEGVYTVRVDVCG